MISKNALAALAIGAASVAVSACSDSQIGRVQDEAMAHSRTAASFKAADEDYFHDMDYGYRGLKLDPAEIRGRNTWIVWTFGSDRFWDYMANHTFGAFDLLKVLSSYQEAGYPETGYCTEDKYGWHSNKYDGKYDGMDRAACQGAGQTWVPLTRDNRWKYYGLVNEPCFEKATGPGEYGLWLDKRVPASAECPEKDPFDNEAKYPGVKFGARGSTVPVGSYYGKPSGIVGLRLFPNPDFDEAAKRKWDARRYYTDEKYYNDQNLVRPYRVGMSCGFCHVGPNPVNPPADPENPKWANLNSNPGAQYFWVDRIFVWNPKNVQANFIFQLFHTSLPGSLDTSFVSTDNINNPRTMNAVYNVAARAELGKYYKEKLAGGGLLNKQFNDYDQTKKFLSQYFQPPDTVFAPHILKDGSDSVGVLGALNRVFINIGLFSEEWLLHFRPLVGGKEISPIKIADADKNSVYWQVTTNQTADMALFFLKTAQPDYLKDAPNGASLMTTDQGKLDQGKTVFAENCARCHSSKQPPNLCMLGQPCTSGQIIENSAEYFRWMRTEVAKPDFLENNFLSTDRRIPISEMGINACSPLATNGIRDNIWDNFSSDTYKDLPAVGEITLYNPVDGSPWQYNLAGGGRGYVRPASLVSVWSSAPFLQNNSVGPFNGDPSVKGRMDAFDESIKEMLWPEQRKPVDPFIGNKVPGPSYIQRTTAMSFIRVPAGYLPPELTALMDWGPWLHYWLPWLFNAEYDLEIGPIPQGTPVNLLANIQLLAESPHLGDKAAHVKKLIAVLKKIKTALKSLPHDATNEQAIQAWLPVVPDLIAVSKCPDFIVNKGHYFGSNLSDDDKNALIEFLKTF
jgi:hypothetical protein